jgi:hypothetical protein
MKTAEKSLTWHLTYEAPVATKSIAGFFVWLIKDSWRSRPPKARKTKPLTVPKA